MATKSYELPIPFYYYYARFLVLFSLKQEQYGDKYFLHYTGLLFLLHHICRFVIIALAKDPFFVLTEIEVDVTLKALEFFFIFILCVTIFVVSLKDLRGFTYTDTENEMSSDHPRQRLLIPFFKVKFSAWNHLPFFLLNGAAVCVFLLNRKLAEGWRIAFDILEYEICSTSEHFLVNYFINLELAAKKIFTKINYTLRQENLKIYTARNLRMMIDSHRNQFVAACKFYKLLSANFQTNAIVNVLWLFVFIVTFFLSFLVLDFLEALEFIFFWSILPAKIRTVINLGFSIPNEASRAFSRLNQLQPRDIEDMENPANETEDEFSDEIIPKPYVWDVKFFISTTLLILTYAIAVYVAATNNT